jgi:hypothetical protein
LAKSLLDSTVHIMTSTTQKTLAGLLVVALLICLGFVFLQHAVHEVHRLRVMWDGDNVHVFSASDGPFVMTHLARMRDGTNEYAVAQLPSPVTIIDSRGERFSAGFIDSLTWITPSGSTSAPPAVGSPMKAFYYIPEQTEVTK